MFTLLEDKRQDSRSTGTRIITPTVEHGADVWRVAKGTDELDLNSSYMYLLLVRDFADTCRVAVQDDEVVAFVLGYRRSEDPERLFIWQVAVDASHRGEGLASRLVDDLVMSNVNSEAPIRFIETTVTAENTASRNLFGSLAKRWGTKLVTEELFEEEHFPDSHDAERLHIIGPLPAR
ncbi:diaminobutyrate acetyltransferase [Pseudoclavibacter endophyticus]|uniref:L-2,4-diaminobutyric acid acetyltransferase n=2 Tax=Pseudoclavibacter endophyticus TaxID=1778590 RepID=A0A6H9WEU4_9MICO|nr:diaminobutyrate acetyltransferase [Pseudoclavibacter endophyticus]